MIHHPGQFLSIPVFFNAQKVVSGFLITERYLLYMIHVCIIAGIVIIGAVSRHHIRKMTSDALF